MNGRLILAMLLGMTMVSCGKIPDADFTIEDELIVQNSVQFTYTGSEADTYLWDFGDGSTGAIQDPTHKYEKVGEYRVSVAASNNKGSSDHSENIKVRLLPEGEYGLVLLGLSEPLNVGGYVLYGAFTDGKVGQALNAATGGPALATLNGSVTVQDFDFVFNINGISFSDGGVVGKSSLTLDTRDMSGVIAGDLYVISNSEFQFQLFKK